MPPKKEGAMLQGIHQIKAAPRASSLYCRWIHENRRPGAPLVAVWIDNRMRGFERECAPEPKELLQDAWEEPGGVLSFTLQKRAGEAVA
jgi:hypothetical protein